MHSRRSGAEDAFVQQVSYFSHPSNVRVLFVGYTVILHHVRLSGAADLDSNTNRQGWVPPKKGLKRPLVVGR